MLYNNEFQMKENNIKNTSLKDETRNFRLCLTISISLQREK